MPFAYIIEQLTDGRAAKRASWGGYVKRDDTSSGFTLTFKNRSGTEYVYTWDGSSWTAPSTPMSMDAEFLAGMLATDWITGSAADFEAARTGTGTW